MSKNAGKHQFDLVNFFYGAGAAIVLVAAIFKFTGSESADWVFVIGISVEAGVFLVSAFQWKPRELDYRWEQVFPELLEDSDNGYTGTNFKVRVEQIYKTMEHIRSISSDFEVMARLSADMNRVLMDLTASQKDLLQTSDNYRSEIEKLHEHARKINDQANKLFSIAI